MRAAAGDAQVGEDGRRAAARPVSTAAGSHARAGRSHSRFPSISRGRVAANALTAGGRTAIPTLKDGARRVRQRRCRCSFRRSTRTATSARASGCRMSPCRLPLTPAGISGSREIGSPDELVSLLDRRSRSRDARGTRSREGSAPVDRGALPSAGGLPGEGRAGRRRARESRLPARGRRTAHPAAGERSVGIATRR